LLERKRKNDKNKRLYSLYFSVLFDETLFDSPTMPGMSTSLTPTKDQSFPCPVCGKVLYRKKYLKTHMRYHTGERPFVCPVCGKDFADKSNHRKHVFSHQLKQMDAEKRNKQK